MAWVFARISVICAPLLLGGCASMSDRTGKDHGESTPTGKFALDNTTQFNMDEEPLPSLQEATKESEKLFMPDVQQARPSPPRNPFDSWEYRPYRPIVPPAQR